MTSQQLIKNIRTCCQENTNEANIIKYNRRCVPVTLIKVLKTHENYPSLFTFIECLMKDPEREVHQGTSWFLREAWKRKPEGTDD